MKEVATQIGTAFTADFEENTWTFLMKGNYQVWAGEFAIVDKQVYDSVLFALLLAKAELRSNYKRLGFISSNVLDAVDSAYEKLNSEQEVQVSDTTKMSEE